jgi:multidrug efflux pump subunit AcrA (membrane-fusion protein)
VYEATEARLARAEASLNAAKGRLNLYQGTESESASKYLSTIKIGSPINGIIQNVNVTPQQTINASTIMFEVSPVNLFWIRVPVYSGDIEEVDLSHRVSVSTMGNEGDNRTFIAEPVQGPQVGDASSASSYMFYKVENKSGRLRAGQKVSVALILRSTSQSLVVPYSSIIYDMYGGNWVYVRVEPQLYMRKRVELDHIADTLAILGRGVNQGEEVVFNGAVELYGTEFGGGK